MLIRYNRNIHGCMEVKLIAANQTLVTSPGALYRIIGSGRNVSVGFWEIDAGQAVELGFIIHVQEAVAV